MRILAPLLVLALLGLVAFRWAAAPPIDRELAWIEGAWDLASQRRDVKERFVSRLEALVARDGDDAETRWFAARAWLKVAEVARAVDTVFGDPELAAATGTCRRFGSLLLRDLAFVDDVRLRNARRGAAMAALVLAEGGDEAATAWLDETIRTRLEGGYLDLLYGTYLYSTREGSQRVADALRARGEPVTDIVAALAAMGPEPYPERPRDLERLEEIVSRDSDRTNQKIVWSTAVLALGRSEEAYALSVLEDVRARLADATTLPERIDAGVVAAGLIAGGRWEAREDLAPFLTANAEGTDVHMWYADAAAFRVARGDPQAGDAWLEAWEPLNLIEDTRPAHRAAAGLLLRATPPPASFPVDLVLRRLEPAATGAASHAIAAAWRLRQGETEGRDRLLALLRQLQEDGWSGEDLLLADPFAISPVLTAARALYLYDPTLPR